MYHGTAAESSEIFLMRVYRPPSTPTLARKRHMPHPFQRRIAWPVQGIVTMIGCDPHRVSQAAGRQRGKIPPKQDQVSMLFQGIEGQHLRLLQFAPGAD